MSRLSRRQHHELVDAIPIRAGDEDDLLAIDEALEKLAIETQDKATLVKLRYFCGMSAQEAADAMGISRATACR